MKEGQSKIKDKWDKADIVLRALGGVLTALAVASVGFFGSKYLEGRQAEETNLRLYAQLMSGRERAYSDLRKEMFNTIISPLLKAAPSSQGEDLEEDVLALELLAYNYNDVIDLGPLFKHVERKISAKKAKSVAGETGLQLNQRKVEQYSLERRLQGVASDVVEKQLTALEEGGVVVASSVVFHELDKHPEGIQLVNRTLRLDYVGKEKSGSEQKRYFGLYAIDYNSERQELLVRLNVAEADSEKAIVDVNFWVGFFDFPMIDNVRISGSQGVAVVLRNWVKGQSAEVALVYFSESSAGQKETPYYDEVLNELVRTGKVLRHAE